MSLGPGTISLVKKKREGQIPDGGAVENVYLGNALFQDLLVDIKETSSKGVPFDGAGGGNRTFSSLHGILKVKEFHPCALILESSLGCIGPNLNAHQKIVV